VPGRARQFRHGRRVEATGAAIVVDAASDRYREGRLVITDRDASRTAAKI